jgi:DNA-binding NarL/FixJ family response regulator
MADTWNVTKIYRAQGMDLSRAVNPTMEYDGPRGEGMTMPTPIRILVADDSDIMRHSLRRLLESRDHWQVCEEACNGREAVEKVQHSAPDVLLLDFEMPLMNGLEAAREITRRSPGLPILMVSVHMSDQLANEARKIGVRGACSKSNIGCVVEAVETLLQNGTYYPQLTSVGLQFSKSTVKN